MKKRVDCHERTVDYKLEDKFHLTIINEMYVNETTRQQYYKTKSFREQHLNFKKKKIPFQIFAIPYIVVNFDKKLFD